jgi:PAS domain S-box-containing protein
MTERDTLSDRSERTLAEEALFERGRLLNEIFEHGGVGVAHWDLDGRLLMLNQKACNNLGGGDPRQYLGRTMIELFGNDAGLIYQERITMTVESPEALEFEDRVELPVGIRWFHSVHTRVRDAEGRVTGVHIYANNITDLKQTEAALHKSKHMYDTLVSKISVGIYILRSTPEGTYSLDYVSPRMAELVNCSIESLLKDSRRFFVNFHPDDRDGFVTLNQEGIALRQPFDWQGRILVEGTVRWLHIESSPETQMDGDVLWHGVVTDITGSKQADEEVKKKNAEIEQFIYTVSHDLRSPLVTVKTFLGYLEGDMTAGNQERIVQDLQFIHGATDKMKMLLDELLELSRVDRIESPQTRVPLREVLAEALDTLAGLISERGVDIRLPDTELLLFGDRPRLCQIWQNLIENAIKYSPDGASPLVELGVRQENGETVFFVSDKGIGIDPKYHSKVFGLFEKLDPKSSGVGLGLSMIQRIVEKSAGRIWVESEGIGSGSCFYFTLPKAVVHE